MATATAPAPPECCVCLLGRPQLRVGGAHAHDLERRDAALLAALVVDGAVSREHVAAWLWPSANHKAAQNSLRQRMYRLRQMAGRDLFVGGNALQLAPDVLNDIDSFANRLAAGGATEDELLATLDYSDFAAGNAGGAAHLSTPRSHLAEWVEQARADWRQRRYRLMAKAADLHEQAGAFAAALSIVERLLREDCVAERVHRQCMRLHYLHGDRARALAAFQQCVTVLARELGTEPDPATRALATLIAKSGTVAPPAGTAVVPIPLPLSILRPPRLVARNVAWHSLERAWQRHDPVWLTGEPGMGKSRLLADFAQTRGDTAVLAALSGDEVVPHVLLQRLLPTVIGRLPSSVEPWITAEFARLLPELGEPPVGRLEPLRLQRALVQALAKAHTHETPPDKGRVSGLQAIFIDDVQFADAASLDLILRCWTPPSRDLPRLLLAVRTGEQPERLSQWLADQPTSRIVEIKLQALKTAEIAEFVESLGLPGCDADAWAVSLAQRTGGNPLFMLQVLAAAQATDIRCTEGDCVRGTVIEFPTDVHKVIERRLQQLSPGALRLARVAALAGPDFSLQIAADVLGFHVIDLCDPLQELEGARLLHDKRLAYDLVGESLLRNMSPDLARLLHAQLAHALTRAGATSTVVASHHALAGQWGAAAAMLDIAAGEAHAASARQVEMELFDRAADAHRRAGDGGAAWHAAERALAAAHAFESTSALNERAGSLLAAAVGPLQRMKGLLHQARIRLSANGGKDALTATLEAVPLAHAVGSGSDLLTATAWHGLALTLAGQWDEGLPFLEAALPLAHEGLDARARLNFFGSLGYALHVSGRYRDAVAPIRAAAEIAATVGELGDCLEQTSNLAVCCNSIGDVEGGLEATHAALTVWRTMGEPEGLMADTTLVQCCTTLINQGQYRQALALLPAVADRLTTGTAPHWGVIANHRLALLYIRLGQPARASQALRPLAPDATPGALAARAIFTARLAHLAGRTATAVLRDTRRDLDGRLERLDKHSLLLALAQLTNDPEESFGLCSEVLAETGCDDGAPAWRHALMRRADLLEQQGRADAARRDLEAAWTSAAQRSVLGLETADRCRWAADLACRLGHSTLAQEAITEGLAWLSATVPHVPDTFMESFLYRNPAVRGFRALAVKVRVTS